jgi:flavin-dependent dehydrogenase
MSGPQVVVIGGGPAGACAAIAAAGRGMRTMLVDRRRYPRAKVCGCCLSDAAIASLEGMGVGDVLHDALPLRSVRLVSGGRQAVLARTSGAAISRRALDARLVERAASCGVEVVDGTAARLDPEGTVTIGAHGGTSVRPACTVVADGLGGSSLDGVPGFGWRITPRNRIGIGTVAPGGSIDCPRAEIRMHVCPEGYLGAVQLEDGSIDMAAAIRPDALRGTGGPAAWARACLGDAVIDPRALADARWAGTPALTRRRETIAAPRILVAGDAAGYVEPFTGEGMGWAIATGAAAGALAAACVDRPDAWREWPAMHRSLVGSSRLRCRAIAVALRHPAIVGAAIALGHAAPRVLGTLADVVGRRPASAPRTEAAIR